jgi:RNA polymerase sigma factor (sigma-70 family)
MSYLRQRPGLVERFREGDRDALTEVYREYVSRIAGLLRRGFLTAGSGLKLPGCANPDDFAEALQDVFTRAFDPRAREAYDGRRNYSPYLAAIARSVVVTRYRRGRKELLISDDSALIEDAVAPSDECSTQWLNPQFAAIAHAYVWSLGEPMRALYHARYVDALSQRDAAKRLGLSRSKLRKLEDALQQGLRRLLSQEGIQLELDP